MMFPCPGLLHKLTSHYGCDNSLIPRKGFLCGNVVKLSAGSTSYRGNQCQGTWQLYSTSLHEAASCNY